MYLLGVPMNQFSLEELKKIKQLVSQYKDVEVLKHDLDITISNRKKKKKKSLNEQFDIMQMIELKILEPIEIDLLLKNHIDNLQELLECNLDSLKGMNQSIKESLEWKRHFYNMRNLEEKGKTK